mmetsp:Transcript_28857/g.48961  ORF Transcript_28857/g.48961 Transcript_28857/m.48961 type:complete len:2411 (-) Transcript_28857:179-7411(-)
MAPTPGMLKRQLSEPGNDEFVEAEFRAALQYPPTLKYPSTSPLKDVFDQLYLLRNRKWWLEASSVGLDEAKVGCPKIKEGKAWMLAGEHKDTLLKKAASDFKDEDLEIDVTTGYLSQTVTGNTVFSTISDFWNKTDETVVGGQYHNDYGHMKYGRSFIWLYALFCGDVSASINGRNDAHTLASMLTLFLGDFEKVGPYQSLLHVLSRNRALCRHLPKIQTVFVKGNMGGHQVLNSISEKVHPGFGKVMKDVRTLLSKEGSAKWGPLDWGRNADDFVDDDHETKHKVVKVEHPSSSKGDEVKKDASSVPTAADMREWLTPDVSDFRCSSRKIRAFSLLPSTTSSSSSLPPLAMDMKLLRTLATQPLKDVIGLDTLLVSQRRAELKMAVVPSNLPPVTAHCVAHHPEARSQVARELKRRLEDEMVKFAEGVNSSTKTTLKGLTEADLVEIIVGENGGICAKKLQATCALLEDIKANLVGAKNDDADFVERTRDVIVSRSNAVHLRDELKEGGADKLERSVFVLNRFAQRESFLAFDHLVAVLLSSVMVYDVKKVNPFLASEEVNQLMDAVVGVILRISRMGQINRCLLDLHELLDLLQNNLPKLAKEGALKDARTHEAVRASIIQKTSQLVGNLTCKRHYMKEGEGEEGGGLFYDPRYLVFEFTWNLILRKKQINLIDSFMRTAAEGKSSVRQLIMGAGKTTVVCPMLSLMLGDGDALVVQVVPQALLPFSMDIMRATFSSIVQKRIYTFAFDRSSKISPHLFTKLDNARKTRGILVTHPTALKSIMLRFIEILHTIDDSARKRNQFLEHEAAEVNRVLGIFRSSVVLMDEVDLILHPLKSELNFPVGPKKSLDFEPLRWQLAIHTLDAFFFSKLGRISVDFENSKHATAVLERLKTTLDVGCKRKMIQQTPHLVLLDDTFYHDEIKPIMAEWLLLWLEVNHTLATVSRDQVISYLLHGTDVASLKLNLKEAQEGKKAVEGAPSSDSPFKTKEAIETEISRREALARALNDNLDKEHIQMISLGRDWLQSYLPHVMQKINRVTFGILNAKDIHRAKKRDPHMPRTRLKLAIPFVGKDKPSESSEFAHPDIIIGLTILAYRYSGIRQTDFDELLQHLITSFQKELGPAHERKSSVMHAKWVKEAGGFVKGSTKKFDEFGNEIVGEEDDDDDKKEGGGDKKEEVPEGEGGQEDEKALKAAKEVVPLQMLKRSNMDQTDKLFKLLKKNPGTIHWYLTEFVFPSNTMHQVLKLSASGQALGGDMLFDRRIGFSGTPSSLLPLEMGKCGYERGADGLMMHYLTDPDIVSYEFLGSGWSPKSLLKNIAQAQPHYNSLIDTGALITGMSNLQVAGYLLDKGLSYAEGVVFLNEDDDKMVLMRSTRRVVRLDQCGIPKRKRFAFYDQIHTTGVDIQHINNAIGVLTLGKDMVFRDYTQGAFRMRGLGKGQKIRLFVIPEIQSLMRRELVKAGVDEKTLEATDTSVVLDRVTAWQIVNGMRSQAIQHNQLQLQNVANVWRKNTFNVLKERHASFKVKLKTQDKFLSRIVHAFQEEIDFRVPSEIKQPVQFDELINGMVDENRAFLNTDEERAAVEKIVKQVQFLLRSSENLNMEITTQATREQTIEQDKDQEKEILQEKFVDLAYSEDRDDNRFWPLENLKSLEKGTMFYPCNEFALYEQTPIKFPQDLRVSTNYFDKSWKGDRRLKNVVMVLEWIPDDSKLVASTRSDTKLTEEQSAQLDKAFSLFHSNKHSEYLGRRDLKKIVRAAVDYAPAAEDIAAIMGGAKAGHIEKKEAMKKLKSMLVSGAFRKVQAGRFYVALSLEEAETIRRAIHLRGDQPFFADTGTRLALRCLPDNFTELDSTPKFHGAGSFQEAAAYLCLRFLDCDMYYNPSELNILLKALQESSIRERENFFSLVIACRRRMRKKWAECPIAKLFTLPDEFHLLKLRAGVDRTREAIERKGMQLQDAFTLFDTDENGVLSPSELYGALEWLGITGLTPADIMDLVRHVDMNRDGNISFGEFQEAVQGSVISYTPDAAEEEGGLRFSSEAGPPLLTRTPSTKAAFESAKAGTHVIAPKGVEELKQLQKEEVERQKKIEAIEKEREAKMKKRMEAAEGDVKSMMKAGMLNPVKEEPFTVQNVKKADGKQHQLVQSTVTTWEFTKKVLPKGLKVHGGSLTLQPDPEFEKKSNYLSLKPNSHVAVPFAKANGGDGCKRLNRYTLTMEIMVDRLPRTVMSLLQIQRGGKETGGKPNKTGDLFLHPNGTISLFRNNVGAGHRLSANEWAVVGLAMDNIAGTCVWYVGGKICDTSTNKDLMYKDGPLSVGANGFGVFRSGNPREMFGGNIRRMYMHTEVLTPKKVDEVFKKVPKGVAKEDVRKKLLQMGFPAHAIEDAIANTGREDLQELLTWLQQMGYGGGGYFY